MTIVKLTRVLTKAQSIQFFIPLIARKFNSGSSNLKRALEEKVQNFSVLTSTFSLRKIEFVFFWRKSKKIVNKHKNKQEATFRTCSCMSACMQPYPVSDRKSRTVHCHDGTQWGSDLQSTFLQHAPTLPLPIQSPHMDPNYSKPPDTPIRLPDSSGTTMQHRFLIWNIRGSGIFLHHEKIVKINKAVSQRTS